jgi:hypothetical protein
MKGIRQSYNLLKTERAVRAAFFDSAGHITDINASLPLHWAPHTAVTVSLHFRFPARRLQFGAPDDFEVATYIALPEGQPCRLNAASTHHCNIKITFSSNK